MGPGDLVPTHPFAVKVGASACAVEVASGREGGLLESAHARRPGVG